MKKKCFSVLLVLTMIVSIGTIAYAKSEVFRYPNGYIMSYNLFGANIGGKSGAGASTSTEDEATSFVAIFSYKGDVVRNSGTKQRDYYVYLGIPGNGGNTFVSHHSLKYPEGRPIGSVKKITLY